MVTVTIEDYERLLDILKLTHAETIPSYSAYALVEKITVARKVPASEIEKKLVTMNSKVLLRETKSGRQSEVTITYPREAEPAKRLISVLSPIGVALLGHQEQEIVSWSIPSGIGCFEILKVTYQPEAAGHYHL